MTPRRRFFVPEVVQTSAMDCGPAALKCLLEGFGVAASYGRLREACQTDVDGTSIDTMEEVAHDLGLEAEQVMLPLDHLLLEESAALPAIVVVRLPNGLTHFVVLWRRHGGRLQVMDPATGRRWPGCRDFLDEVYLHTMAVPAADWREWAATPGFTRPLGRRLASLGLDARHRRTLLAGAAGDPSWRSLGALDAATRMVAGIVDSGGLRRGREASAVLASFHGRAATGDGGAASSPIPPIHWSARAADPSGETLLLRGAVLVRVRGRRRAAPPPRLSRDLGAALSEPRTAPGRELLRLLFASGRAAPIGVALAVLPAAAAVVLEGLLFRGLIDLGRDLGLSGQRLAAAACLLIFVAATLLLRLPLADAVLRLGRRIDLGLRTAFLAKLPRLGDRYFGSRLTSDMAERAHAIHTVRLLPQLAADAIGAAAELAATAAGVIWLSPPSAPLVIATVVLAVGLPLLAQPVLIERDLRVRNHRGALARFYLDALLGLVAVRTHGAERAVRREHEALLVTWARASLGHLTAAIAIEGAALLLGFGLAAAVLLDHLAHGSGGGSVLLLVYWTLGLPLAGDRLSLAIRQYPGLRNAVLRLLEPLAAPEETSTASTAEVGSDSPAAPGARAAAIVLDEVSVKASGHTILEGVHLAIAPGEHVAVVGPSGAGKSTLIGLLLGWHRPASGCLRVDGSPLDAAGIEALRRDTAWVDGAVQLWNRSLLDNLRYGAGDDPALPVSEAIAGASLRSLLEKLPDGLQTSLGEGGALVSGGEGQRVRLGRALIRRGARLVLLDEPFRGLDRGLRRELLARARAAWSEATLLCVTHDVGETLGFARVLVVEQGRVVEDGDPVELAGRDRSRYRAMLEAERDVRERLWSGSTWRHLRLEDGRIAGGARDRG